VSDLGWVDVLKLREANEGGAAPITSSPGDLLMLLRHSLENLQAVPGSGAGPTAELTEVLMIGVKTSIALDTWLAEFERDHNLAGSPDPSLGMKEPH
jgi:hypothetical protein